MSEAQTRETLRAMIKEIVGEEKAALTDEAAKFVESIEKRFGSVDAAKAQGVNMNFFAREGMSPMPAKSQNKAGKYLRTLAAARGNLSTAKSIAAARGDKELAASFERVMDTQAKAMAGSVFSDGGALIPEEFSAEVIELLYSKLGISELGVDVIPMPNGQLTIPFLDTGATAAYVGEAATIASSQMAVGQLQLTAKKLAAVVPISNDLLRTPSAKADQFVQNDLIRRLRVRAEQAFIRGVGAAGEPKGVRNWAIAANVQAMAGTTLADKVNDLGKLQRLTQDLDVPQDGAGYLLAPRTEWALKTTLDGLGNFVFMKAMEAGVLMGVPFRSTTLMTTTPNAEIIFGCFGNVVIGDTEQIEITVHPDGSYVDGGSTLSGVNNDVTPVRAIARHDLGCRYRGKEIAVLTGVTY